MFPDVEPGSARWRARGVDVRIYSSGSVLAQQLLFSTCADGDLTRLLKQEFSAGQELAVEVFRVVEGSGSRKMLTLTLGERPQQ